MTLEDWIEFRRQLHRRPEISGEERETAARVESKLQADAIWTAVGGHGVVAAFRGADPGPVVMLRAELDGLPIAEWEGVEHRSEVPGKSHACGHDGHATILLVVAERLALKRPRRGTVLCVWQPAEENGKGAVAMTGDARWGREIPRPDEVYALHNLPGVPLGTVVTRGGAFTAAVRSLIVRYDGKTAHAAEPEQGVNPAAAVAELVLAMLAMNQPERGRPDFAVVTPIHLELGEVAYGVAAGHGVARFTIRTWDEREMERLVATAECTAERIAETHGLQHSIEWTEVFSSNRNDPAAVAAVERASRAVGAPLSRANYPFRWGEDFGHFTQMIPGAMLGLGAGENTPALHNPDYDFPDALISIGSELFLAILEDRQAHWIDSPHV